MTIKVGVGSAWKLAPIVKVGVGGAWKSVTRAWVGVGGAWKEFYQAVLTQITSTGGSAATLSPTTCTASYKLDSDGNIYSSGGTGAYVLRTPWLVYGAAGDYEVYATLSSGTASAGTFGSWLALNTDRAWSVASGAINTPQPLNFTLAIRLIADGTVTTAATAIAITAERYT